MRVIGGAYKGRRLASFTGLDIRPTSDKVREAVFNILAHGASFRRVLDLFAGTGAFGIEALSRGAEEVVFVDGNPKAITLIKKNIESCLASGASVHKQDAFDAIKTFSRLERRFDLIFVDPPYAAGLLDDLIEAIDVSGILNDDGVIIAESSKRAPLARHLKRLDIFDERRYGDTVIYFIRRTAV